MSYRFLEDLSIADTAFEATGKTLKEVFESSALAVTNTMIRNLESIEQKVKKKIKVESDTAEMLLFNFLQELVFYKDAEQLIFSRFNVDIAPIGKKWKLSVIAYGEKLDKEKHQWVVDVKAVTLHHFELKETDSGWRAQVVLDI
ncbi:archease [archaeon]|nr:MAG: archease [archaeon]